MPSLAISCINVVTLEPVVFGRKLPEVLVLPCRSAVAQALPQLQLLDRQPLDNERKALASERGPAAQHIAELQLQAYQPPTDASDREQYPLAAPAAAAIASFPLQPYPWQMHPPQIILQGVAPQDTTHMQCMQLPPMMPAAPGLPKVPSKEDVQNLADRLAQRLAQSGLKLPHQDSAELAKQEERWASMEARLGALLEGRVDVPHQPQACDASDTAQVPLLHEDVPGIRGSGLQGAARDQQPVRHGSRCSGPQVTFIAVQRLQVSTLACACHQNDHDQPPVCSPEGSIWVRIDDSSVSHCCAV